MGYCILTEDTQPHYVSSNFPFLGHLQETFSIHDGQFKEGTHYFVIEKVGSGAFGECYKAYTSNNPSTFCAKKVRQRNGVLTFHSKGRNACLLFRGKEVAVLG